MAKILIYGNSESPLVRNRGLIGKKGNHQIFWVSAVKAHLPGVTAFGLPRISSRSRILRSVLEPLLVWRVIRTVRPDLIHVHYASKGLGSLPLLGKTPLIASVMGSDILPEVGYKGLYALFTRMLLDHANVITSKSAFLDRALLSIGNYRTKIVRVVWGIDLNTFKPKRNVSRWRSRLHISDRTFIFFDPRNAKPLYNTHVVIEAFARYQAMRGPQAILLLATGNAAPGYLVRLKSQLKRLKLEKQVRLLKTLAQEEMADLFCLSDVTISVPNSDGLPQSILEALACNSFLILSDLPQYVEIVKKCSGVEIVPAGNSEVLAKKMIRIATRPTKLKKIKNAHRDYIKSNADFQNETKRVLQLYAQVLKREGSR